MSFSFFLCRRNSGGIFGWIAANKWMLFDVEYLSAHRTAFIIKPAYRCGSNFFWQKNSSRRSIDFWEFSIPIIIQSMFTLTLDLFFGKHPPGVDLVHTHTILAMKGITKIAGHCHQSAF